MIVYRYFRKANPPAIGSVPAENIVSVNSACIAFAKTGGICLGAVDYSHPLTQEDEEACGLVYGGQVHMTAEEMM